MDELLGDFIAETRETLEAIAEEIVAWESNPADRARLDAIFRFVHTVKGSCGFLDLPRLEKLSHAAEDALADCRADRREPDAAFVTAVLSIIDRIGELVSAIESGEPLPDEEDHGLIAALAPGHARAAPTAALQPGAQRAVARSIRVPVDLLDGMMAGVSDLVLARNELARRLREIGDRSADDAFDRLSVSIGEMRDTVTRTRMARVDHLFAALPRLVRDLSAELGKAVTLRIDGGDVELDREMIEMIRDPLTHIVRNAIDHGIEAPADRVLGGKPRSGALTVAARQAGNQILIEVADDGRGIDGDRLVQKAVASGLLTAEAAEAMTWRKKLDLIFAPGLSTAQTVTAISGRGVGMDVVRANVERIGGAVEVDSRPGEGLRLTMRVPLTLTIIPALTISTGGQQFAIPRSAIEEIVRVGRGARIEPVGGVALAGVRGERLPLVSLAGVLGQAAPEPAILIMLKLGGGGRYALGVDAVHDHEELVVKPAAPAIMAIGVYAGATLPDDSRPMLLLDPAGIADKAGISGGAAPLAEDAVDEQADERVQTLLFKDLDGRERAIRLAVVERIEDVPAHAVDISAGHRRLTVDDRVIPLLGHDPKPGAAKLRVLRLNDGAIQFAYGIEAVVDIVALAAQPIGGGGTISGVALVEGRQVELLDPHALFAEAARVQSPAGASRPVALVAGQADGWARDVLRPLVEAAGYSVRFADEPGSAAAALVFVQEGDTAATPAGARVVTLRERAEGGTGIWRYDRDGLLDALAIRQPSARS